MAELYICIHGHFYQPPRENPWLEEIEVQDSASPYHDWNERVAAECYTPNAASRILGREGKIREIANNYAGISFNFGPTLLSWMERHTPETYAAVLRADRESSEKHSGHGNAMAQAYHHIIMPLANMMDKRTQVLWGIKDFEHRFGRTPEGMWLPETAVDLETLDILAGQGILFTILTPRQALKVRKMGTPKWKDVTGEKIDPTTAYRCALPSGRTVTIFFADGPVSRAVAFEKLLDSGEGFASRLLAGFSESRDRPQIMHVATDGESYGHHHTFGDMALAYALGHIESSGRAVLCNYGEYLEKHPPDHEVRILENSSWSCVHGIERWRSDCGCSSGANPDWNQEWRAPLRYALNWLRDELAVRFELMARDYLKDPWKARDGYIDVILSRTEERVEEFIGKHSSRALSQDEKTIVLRLMEMQRHALLMYTSCGWFFDDLSNIETVQILQYAGRAIQLAEELAPSGLEDEFMERIGKAKSNKPEYRDGTAIYGAFVRPGVTDLKKVAAHYAVSSLFEEYGDRTDIYRYTVSMDDYERAADGAVICAVGAVTVSSHITRVSEKICFSVVHFGDHSLNGGAHTCTTPEAYGAMKDDIWSTFGSGHFGGLTDLMDRHFGTHRYSLTDLFKDEQRKVLTILTERTMKEFLDHCRVLYGKNLPLMDFVRETGMPVPLTFKNAAGHVLNHDLGEVLGEETLGIARVREILNEMKKWDVPLHAVGVEFMVRERIEEMMNRFAADPSEIGPLLTVSELLGLLKPLPVEINVWKTQNIYYCTAKTVYRDFLLKSRAGDEKAAHWVKLFQDVGKALSFSLPAVLPKE